MQITLTQFERIDGIRSSMLHAERGLPASVCTFPAQMSRDVQNIARLESRLFDAIIDVVGYADACDIGDLGEYADSLVTDCLLGKVDVLDVEGV